MQAMLPHTVSLSRNAEHWWDSKASRPLLALQATAVDVCVISDHKSGQQSFLCQEKAIELRYITQPQSTDNPSKHRSPISQTMLISDQRHPPPPCHAVLLSLYFPSFRPALSQQWPPFGSLPLTQHTHGHACWCFETLPDRRGGEEGGGAVALSLQRHWTAKKENKPQSAGLLAKWACDRLECLQSGKGALYSPC